MLTADACSSGAWFSAAHSVVVTTALWAFSFGWMYLLQMRHAVAQWGDWPRPPEGIPASDNCECCTTDKCTNMVRWMGLRKQEVEAHTSTIFIVVGIFGWYIYDAPWQHALNMTTVGIASTLHHAFPRQHSLFHRLDNIVLLGVALLFSWLPTASQYVFYGVPFLIVAVYTPLKYIKIGSVLAILYDFQWGLQVAHSPDAAAVHLVFGVLTAICYGSTDQHWVVHSVWHFVIAWWSLAAHVCKNALMQ